MLRKLTLTVVEACDEDAPLPTLAENYHLALQLAIGRPVVYAAISPETERADMIGFTEARTEVVRVGE